MSDESDKTLILNRRYGELWLDTGKGYISVLYDITGVKRLAGDYNPVQVLRGGNSVGIIWDIKEIKERW